MGVCGVIAAFAPNFIVFVTFRTLQGVFGKGSWFCAYVAVTEFVGSSYRRVVGIIAQLFFTLGVMILPGVAYLIPSWRWLQLAITLPNFAFLLYYWVVPESPRWLFSRNRTEEAIKIAQNIAKHNGKLLPPSYSEMRSVDESTKELSNPAFLDLVRTPRMRKYTLIVMYAWFTSAVVYQGLVMRLGIVEGDLYLGFFISAVAELPAAFIILLTLDRVGRRLPFSLANIVAGISCIITAFIPEDLFWLKTTIATVGRLAITMAFEIVYIVNTELYPTNIRNFSVSVCSGLCDLGGIVAPFLLYRLAAIWLELPLIMYSILAVICGALILLLPETKGIALPETIEDVENLSKRKNIAKTEEKHINSIY
uniref:Solute carrier family 22 member 3 n=1 Tax=Latimeria chalumnae TaxID=7897 RepID=M3XJJ2_LATCH|nr:PREDICTED: solute carrier family 22 member 3 [Latimeria chalumnae]|eukprot:XP_014353777.1 PREDICTED: solute carrier family 22 member 3 [Latimeria chalumnae]